MSHPDPDQPQTPKPFSWQTDAVIGPLLERGRLLREELSQKDDPTSPKSLASSQRRYADPGQTLIFLDWDDTLFPTTELFDQWHLSSRFESWKDMELSDEQEGLLTQWRGVLQQYLSLVCSLTERCIILTNAMRPWVDRCIDRFAPNLRPFFDSTDRLRVIYARELLETKRSSRPVRKAIDDEQFAWKEDLDEHLTQAKFKAMLGETKEFYSRYPQQTWKNIVSVGDSKYERNAIQELVFQRNSPQRELVRVKSIMTPVEPSLTNLTYRLRLALVLWSAYVQHDGDLDLDMNGPERLQACADALHIPELKEFIHPGPISDEDPKSIEEALDEAVVIMQNSLDQ